MTHHVRLTSGDVDLAELKDRLAQEQVKDLWVSSEEGAAVLLTVLRAHQTGLPASIDRLAVFDAIPNIYSDGGPDDVKLNGFANGYEQPNVTRAWQYLQLVDSKPVKVCVIDHGFRVTAFGTLAPGPGLAAPDLPPVSLYAFGIPSFGSPGPVPGKGYHGHKATMTLAGVAGNAAGTAGSSGGAVSDAMLIEFDKSMSGFYTCVNAARLFECKVLSISVGWSLDSAFQGRWATPDAFFEAFQKAEKAGMIVVVSAGNGDNLGGPGYKLPDRFVVPATRCAGTITVGALEPGTLTPRYTSNYGSSVDIWAPTLISVPNVDAAPGPGPAPGGATPTTTFGGTSAAAPFIAGVVALLKSVRPDLTSEQAAAALRASAWTSSTDKKVDFAVNAFGCLRHILGGHVRANATATGSSNSPRTIDLFPGGLGVAWGGISNLTIEVGQVHYFVVNLPFQLNRVRFLTPHPSRLNSLTVNVKVLTGQETGQLSWQDQDFAPTRFFPPSQILITASAPGPCGYDLGIHVESVTLQPDAFEPNDSPGSETVIDNSSPWQIPANISTPQDVDRFRVAISRKKSDTYSMEIAPTDGPIVVHTASNAPFGETVWPGSTIDLSSEIKFTVRAGGPTRYEISWSLMDLGQIDKIRNELDLDELLTPFWIQWSNPKPWALKTGRTQFFALLPPNSGSILTVWLEDPRSTVRVKGLRNGAGPRVSLGLTVDSEGFARLPLRGFETGPALIEVDSASPGFARFDAS